MSTIRVVNLQHTDATEPNIVLESDGTAIFASGITISGATTLTVSGTAEFASGTAAAPKLTFIDDNDTGIYSPAVNNLGITTSGTAALTIDSSQQVGIGTTSPGSILDVRQQSTGSSAEIRLFNTDQTNATTQEAAVVISPDSRAAGTRIVAIKENADFSTNPGRDVALAFESVLNGTQTERMRITSTGQMRLAGAGITFNGDTAAANELDDYEEGTWTPTISEGTFTRAYGYYTRIGRVVFAAFGLEFPSSSSGTRVQVQNLPYTNINPGASNLPNFGYAVGYTNSGRNVGIHMDNNANTFNVYDNDGSDLTYAEFTGKDFRGVAIYFTV